MVWLGISPTLVLDLWQVAAIFGALNAAVLVIRISAEERPGRAGCELTAGGQAVVSMVA